MIKPLANRVLIEPDLQEEKTANGIYLPENSKEQPEKGKIISIGLDVKNVKKGDYVFFVKYGPTEIKIDNKEYLIAREEDILAII